MCHIKKSDTKREYTHSVYRRTVHTLCCRMWIKHEVNIPLQKAGLVTEEKERKEEHHTIFCTNNDADKAEEFTDLKKPRKVIFKFIDNLNKMQSTEFTCPRRKNEFWQTASTPSLCTSPC